jgi:tetratricopeptide (TPR) repeat protein
MPHVADLQKEYRDKGVTVIGFSAADPNNSAEKVAGFIKKRGPKLGYTFAFADNRDTFDAYMKAAKQNGIPCSYVVGKDGKLAFIGHPAFLDYVLPRVLAGTWDPKEGAAEVARADADFDKAYAAVRGKDVEQGLKALSELEEKRPALADSVYFSVPRITLLIRAKKFEEARAAADKAITKACVQEDPLVLRQASIALRVPAVRGEKALLALAVKAVDAFVRIDGDQDPASLLIASETHAAAGDATQAKEYSRKALAVAEAAVAAEGTKPTSVTMFHLAETYFATGDLAKAKEWGAKAVEAAPNQAQKDAYRRAMEKYDGTEGKGRDK